MWTTFIYDGKSDPMIAKMDDAIESPFSIWKTHMEPYSHPVNVGRWGQYTVWDYTSSEQKMKHIVLEDAKGQYRTLLYQNKWCTADVTDSPEIFEVCGQSVLGYRTRIPGTGHFFIEHYWVLDEHSGYPVLVDDTNIRCAVPDGYEVRKGGGLDFKAMSYSTSIWGDPKSPNAPVDEYVTMRLTLKGAKLHVLSIEIGRY